MAAGDPLSGKDGTIKLGDTPAEIHNVKNWKISRKVGVRKFGTNSSGGGKRAVAGNKDHSGSFDMVLDDTNPIPIEEGETYAAQFHVDGSDGQYYSGNVVIESIDDFEVDMDEGKEVGYSVKFQVDKVLTPTGAMLTA